MICQTCKCAEATIHLKEIKGNLLSEVHLCQQCYAQQTEAETMAETTSEKHGVASDMPGAETQQVLRCDACGLPYSAFLETGRLGCAECYHAFATELEPFLLKIHGETRHRGKSPREETKSLDLRLRLTELQRQLDQAIAAEQYERAASLRDQIREFERQTSGVSDV